MRAWNIHLQFGSIGRGQFAGLFKFLSIINIIVYPAPTICNLKRYPFDNFKVERHLFNMKQLYLIHRHQH